ncbi:MAG: protein of unknown function (DUF4332) [Phormidesmis priestleyi Ana]|uniref:DUF4332 domain-containing protein n=1 Tax=Phormidesmis priestleyi Ana TaxID=1666911 RepID=A0A0P8C1S5_9CYAN|nr:MAG: protein of unknown function (DUF4332) [Phormidesmis priestleyi Ana]
MYVSLSTKLDIVKLPKAYLVKSANHSVAQLPGLSQSQIEQLKAIGIVTTFDLLRQGNSVVQRQQLSKKLSTNIKHIHKWAALANLSRIPSVGCQYCGLLLHAGVSTPQQLATMSVQQLHPQLLRLQVQLFNRVDRAPDTAQVAAWIQQAQQILA